ncbi:MAG: hypothetical protein BBJ60_00570 [Desulfobacterales bacterium S7086C20]|nr:MAG: hypothetical protein BBJ60_00570 [Desulfobacterales bacterium S7086C20]
MVSLYVTSFERSAGKDLITMGLMDRLKRDGFKIGYFKPFGHFPYQLGDIITDKGAWFIHRLFELDDPIESVCPVIITQELKKHNYKKPITGLQEKIEKAFEIISDQKDVVIVHCDYNFSEGSSFGISGSVLVHLLNAHVLFVERYTCDFCIDFLLELKRVIGNPVMGVVFNKVEGAHIEEIEEFVSFFLERNEMKVFGCLPTDSLLKAVEVSELAHILGADVVCCKDGIGALVEGFLVGGMHVDKFITYMIKHPSSAVIVGGDRTDIQLVAIESGARCLILTGDLYPNEIIRTRARANGVPILVAKSDTFTVAKGVEAVVGKLSLQDKQKINHGIKLVDKGFSFENLYNTLNLTVDVESSSGLVQ